MNVKTTRILKEARPLFWPWCAVTLAGVLPLVSPLHRIAEPIGFIGFLVGIPLLAALPFGNEFQHRTLPLLLTQPVGRMEIWGEKLSVTAVAVLSATLVFSLGWRTALGPGPQGWTFLGACVLATLASAAFWTLFARSTLGGIVLNYVVPYSIFIVAWLYLPNRIRESGDFSQAMPVVSIATSVLLGYAGLMLWLGRRKLARFQVTGGMAAGDLMTSAEVFPATWAGWLRCRPRGAVLNLIRKEVRLLQPLWLITLLAVLYLACLAAFGLLPEPFGHGPERRSLGPSAIALMAPLLSLLGLIVLLAGSLSLGEERTAGTHSWHMTLPVSARRQWLLKLFLALFLAPVCAVLLPTVVLIAGGSVLGSPLMFVELRAIPGLLLLAAVLSFASFWCACSVSGTVRATLWLLPLLAALILAGEVGAWAAPQLMGQVVSRLDLLADFGFTNAVSNIPWNSRVLDPARITALLLAPTLLFAVMQSYRLFRAQHQDSTLSVVRSVLPLAMIAFLSSFSLAAFDSLGDHARRQMWGMFRETHEAIEKLPPGTARLDADHPLQLKVEELAQAAPLSERTRRWLADSSITIVPDKPHPGGYCIGSGGPRGTSFVPDKTYGWYVATIHRPEGSRCTVLFQAGCYGVINGECK